MLLILADPHALGERCTLDHLPSWESGIGFQPICALKLEPVVSPSQLPRLPVPACSPQLCSPGPFGPTINGEGAGCPATCGKTGDAGAPSVNAPFYGMLLTQMALRGLPSLVQVGETPATGLGWVTCWPLWVDFKNHEPFWSPVVFCLALIPSDILKKVSSALSCPSDHAHSHPSGCHPSRLQRPQYQGVCAECRWGAGDAGRVGEEERDKRGDCNCQHRR